MNEWWKYIIIIGIAIVGIGFVIHFFDDKMDWMGQLPGDIRIENDDFKFYFPFATLIIMSILLNLIIILVRKLF